MAIIGYCVGLTAYQIGLYRWQGEFNQSMRSRINIRYLYQNEWLCTRAVDKRATRQNHFQSCSVNNAQSSSRCRFIVGYFAAAFLAMSSFAAFSASLPLSANLQAVLLTKILMYEKSYKESAGVSVYVVNSPLMSEAFSKLIGESSGHIGIKSVYSGDVLPDKRYDLIYLNELALVDEAKAYASKHRAVLVTGKKKLVEKGITLGTSAENGRPKFYLNLTASFSADLNWEPKVLTIVGTFR